MAKAARAARAPTSPNGERVGAGLEVPHRCHDVGRAERVAGATVDPDRSRAVAGPLRLHQDDGAAALRRGGAVEQVEGIRHHARGQDVLGRERPASGVDRLGIVMTVGADHGRGRRHLFGRGAVGEHVAPRHERELGGSEQAVTDDELVGGPRPRGGGRAIGVDAGATGGDQHHVALAGGDQGRGIEQRRDPHGAGPPRTRSEAELERDLRTVRPDDAVDLVRRDAGVGQRAERAHERDGDRVVLGKGARLHRVVDAGDGDTGEGVW